jgi:hypothetical protein
MTCRGLSPGTNERPVLLFLNLHLGAIVSARGDDLRDWGRVLGVGFLGPWVLMDGGDAAGEVFERSATMRTVSGCGRVPPPTRALVLHTMSLSGCEEAGSKGGYSNRMIKP